MPAPLLPPAFSFITALNPARFPLQTFVRTTQDRLQPPRIGLYEPRIRRAQAAALGPPRDVSFAPAIIRRETGAGRTPTIVLGGMVPDASEQVFLLRRFLLRSGDVYYVNYPASGFSLDLLCAQLTDLVDELGSARQPPVVFAVSFGAGIALEWLRRRRQLPLSEPPLAGLVLVSPVTCLADLIAPGAARPGTLIGRALRPFLDPTLASPETTVEKARAIFLRMFEAGAQNKTALRALLSTPESERLRTAVMSTIRSVTAEGARQRVQALAAMSSPLAYFSLDALPLTSAPALVLFAEREDAVLDAAAPVLSAFGRAPRAYFPHGLVRHVKARHGESSVQHASLVFHASSFLPPLQTFYHGVRRGALPRAA